MLPTPIPKYRLPSNAQKLADERNRLYAQLQIPSIKQDPTRLSATYAAIYRVETALAGMRLELRGPADSRAVRPVFLRF